MVVFFFQAEDGIRDGHVTGVQTCALPISITSSGAINIEFNHVDAQKGLALETLAKGMGIDMQDVMTLGDNFNDASMLQMAGRGVAMGNAEPEIKAMCDYTTKANDEHGVAVAIDEMLNEVKAGK